MGYEDFKKEIIEIAKIAKEVPQAFQEKCFEILLNHLLSVSVLPKVPIEKTQLPEVEESVKPGSQLRVFMKKYNVTEEQINKLVTHSEDEVYFLKEPKEKTIAKGQINWSLLLGLKNAILKNKFEVDPEDARSICIDKGYYDTANFMANFKKSNAALFKGLMKAQGEPRILSDNGMQKLAELINTLAG